MTTTAGHETRPQTPTIYLRDNHAFQKRVELGRWLDATAEPDELLAAKDELLTMSPFVGTTGTSGPPVSIRHTAYFEGLEIDEHEDLTTVSRLARGVAAHGRAFAAYVEAWDSSQQAVDEFSRYYLGTWPDTTTWAAYVAHELDWPQQLDERLDEQLRPFVRIDYERLSQELRYGAHVVDDPARSQIHVFRLQL